MNAVEDALILSRAVRLLVERHDDDARAELRNLTLSDPMPDRDRELLAASADVSERPRPSVSPAQLATVLKRDTWRCHYCGRLLIAGGVIELIGALCPDEFPFPAGHHMPLDRTHPAAIRVYPNVDHVHAGSRGGDWTDLDNLVAACTPCNERKSNRPGWTRIEVDASDWCGLIDCYRALAERIPPVRAYHKTWFKALGI
jgi:hypothetical protein